MVLRRQKYSEQADGGLFLGCSNFPRETERYDYALRTVRCLQEGAKRD